MRRRDLWSGQVGNGAVRVGCEEQSER